MLTVLTDCVSPEHLVQADPLISARAGEFDVEVQRGVWVSFLLELEVVLEAFKLRCDEQVPDLDSFADVRAKACVHPLGVTVLEQQE